MAVITISRQMGSLGCDIANIVASKLGYQLVWRELINKAAQMAGAPEMALAAIDELGLFGITPSPQMCLAYRQAVNQVVVSLADHGNVIIVGRAGQVILADREDTMHIRLIASIPKRAERIAEKHNVSMEGALAQIQASDEYRSKYLRRCYKINWNNPDLYHLIINTGSFTLQQAAQLITQAIITRFGN